ncbi:hypothetical protein P9869_43465 [Streptomyces ossamyceticus]|nr:hypothetical protein [Streptomyces ossamyceticus]
MAAGATGVDGLACRSAANRRRRQGKWVGDNRRRRQSTLVGDNRRRRQSTLVGDNNRRRQSTLVGGNRRRRQSTLVGGNNRRLGDSRRRLRWSSSQGDFGGWLWTWGKVVMR